MGSERITFIESGMHFGLPRDGTFYIEKLDLYDRQLNGKGVSSVECITLRRHCVLFIEAKTSAPNPQNNKAGRFTDFLNQIMKI